MKIKAIRPFRHDRIVRMKGAIFDTTTALGRELIARGLAVAVKEPKAPKPERPAD